MKKICKIAQCVSLCCVFCILFIFISCAKNEPANEINEKKQHLTAPLTSIKSIFPNHEKELLKLPNGVEVEKILGLEKPLFIFQGDIVLEEEDLDRFSRLSTRGCVRDQEDYLWPDNEVYYCLDPDFCFVNELNEAIAHWEEKTHLKFISTPRVHNPENLPFPVDPSIKSNSYIYFINSNGNGCYSSYFGRKFKEQYIAIDDWGTTGIIIHEIGHAIGLFHEQCRLDRDQYVTIHWENISNNSSDIAQYTTWADGGYIGADIGPFDFESIMLYHSWEFSKYLADYANNPSLYWDNPVMTKKNGDTFLGQRDSLSLLDIQAVNYLYPNPNEPKDIEPTILTLDFKGYSDGFTLNFKEMISSSDTVYVDFGNGNSYKGLASSLPSVNYSPRTYQIKIWCNKMALRAKGGLSNGTWGAVSSLPLLKVFLSKDTEFTGINFSFTYLNELSYSEAPNFSSITYFNAAFRSTELGVIKSDLFSKAPNAISFNGVFQSSKLREIPVGLFDNNPNARDFNQTFLSNPITSIPQELFNNNPYATDFSGTFSQTLITEIPQELFDNNLSANMFSGTFSRCPITTIPEDLFKKQVNVSSFSGCFTQTLITEIPPKLFERNINVEDFSDVFSNTPIFYIPRDLFVNNTKVKTFNRAFSNCKNLQNIPADIFYHHKNASKFSGTFYFCSSITEIPERLFANNPIAGDFTETFGGTGISSIPEDLFQYTTKSYISAYGTFISCTNLVDIPEDLFVNQNCSSFERTFQFCTSLNNIPEKLFRNKQNTSKFDYVFYSCTSLRNVPENLFAEVSSNSSFLYAFGDCTSLERALPLWENYPTPYNNVCYNGCNNVSNWNNIPANWK